MNELIEKTCCFTGHRNISSGQYCTVFSAVEKTVEELIKQGYLYFAAGGALGFDTIAASAVLKLRKRFPNIKLILVLPCLVQTKGWSKEDIEVYEDIKQQADEVIYTSQKYTRGCMHKRNRYLVDNSSTCVCYLTEDKGGTFYTVNYAKKNKLTVVNIA